MLFLLAVACADCGLTDLSEPADPGGGLRNRPGPERHLSIYSGDSQIGLAEEFLGSDLVVRVTTATGAPVRSIAILFEVLSGGGGLTDEGGDAAPTFTGPVMTVTDGLGLARMRWRLGTETDMDQLVRARPQSADQEGDVEAVTFRARAYRPSWPTAALAGDWVAIKWVFTNLGSSCCVVEEDLLDYGAGIRVSVRPGSDSSLRWRWRQSGTAPFDLIASGMAIVEAGVFLGSTEQSSWMDAVDWTGCQFGYQCPFDGRHDFRRSGDTLTIARRDTLLYTDGLGGTWPAREKLVLLNVRGGP
jgi:hypothetical protein